MPLDLEMTAVNIETARTLSDEGYLVHWRPENLPEQEQYALVCEVGKGVQ